MAAAVGGQGRPRPRSSVPGGGCRGPPCIPRIRPGPGGPAPIRHAFARPSPSSSCSLSVTSRPMPWASVRGHPAATSPAIRLFWTACGSASVACSTRWTSIVSAMPRPRSWMATAAPRPSSLAWTVIEHTRPRLTTTVPRSRSRLKPLAAVGAMRWRWLSQQGRRWRRKRFRSATGNPCQSEAVAGRSPSSTARQSMPRDAASRYPMPDRAQQQHHGPAFVIGEGRAGRRGLRRRVWLGHQATTGQRDDRAIEAARRTVPSPRRAARGDGGRGDAGRRTCRLRSSAPLRYRAAPAARATDRSVQGRRAARSYWRIAR